MPISLAARKGMRATIFLWAVRKQELAEMAGSPRWAGEHPTLSIEAMRLAGVTRLVNFSSETVYGAVEGPVTEDAPNPSTPYAVTKVTTEWLEGSF